MASTSSRRQSSLCQPVRELQSAVHRRTRTSLLRKIKYEVTGHVPRKVDYIENGLLLSLDEVVADALAAIGRPDSSNGNPSDEEEAVFVQVAQILGVISHEGPSFVGPILETNLLQQFVDVLQLPLSTRTTISVLKCLNAIADNLPPNGGDQWSKIGKLAELLYSKRNVRCFGKIVGNARDTVASQQACDHILALLCKTATHEQHKRLLVDAGLLKLLSARLASFVVSEGLVPPRSEGLDGDQGHLLDLPAPAPPFAHLCPCLESLTLLVEDSKPRTALFLANPAILAVLPTGKDVFSPSDIRRAPWGASYFSGGAVPRSHTQGPFDSLLPVAPVVEKVSSVAQSAFPPLSWVSAMPKRRSSFLPTTNEVPQLATEQDNVDDVDESSVVPWLLYLVRNSQGKRRLLAARLVVNLYRLNLIRRDRVSSFTSLVVPILTKLLDVDPGISETQQLQPDSNLCNGLHYARVVPHVLAALVMDEPKFQKAAVDGNAIVKLSAGLKMTFNGQVSQDHSPWHPQKRPAETTRIASSATALDMGGPSWAARREMDYREGCLKALASLTPFEEDYRKETCDQGVLPYMVLALEPYSWTPADDRPTGNSASVILAACGAVRALARSVTALRTKLIEAEVSKPIIKLMSSANPEVRIAATRALANLAFDFSPAKDSVGEPTIVKKLCEQAHSANARLRSESLCALKQLVLNANRKLKQDVVDELGSSWIKLLIKTDPYDIPEGEVIGLVERDYPPLTTYRRPTATLDHTQDVIMSEDSDGGFEDESFADPPVDPTSTQNDGFNMVHTVEDDTEIQAQLLDLLRNLFCGDNASDLVQYIFNEMGQDDFFRILLDRLRPRTMAGPTRKENFTIPAPCAVVVKVLYILVHIAACGPRWRNFMASQQALMKQVMSFCAHPDREIRAQCCWIVTNLIVEDDVSDRTACRHRAIELSKIGFVPVLRKLESDPDLNVRERAKSAVHLMAKLISP